MKRLKFALYSILAFTVTTIVGCSKDDSSNPSTIDRNEFIVGKTTEEQGESFKKLSVNDKFALWDNKLEQLLSQKLPIEQLNLIKELKTEINNVRLGKTNRFQEIAINLAEITPEQDFIEMFSSLENYTFKGEFSSKTKTPQYVIDDLKNLKLNFSVANDVELNDNLSKKRECSCRWTCWMTGGESTTNCVPTIGGCGFFLMQDCTHYPG